MKLIRLFCLIVLVLCLIAYSQEKSDFPVLKGPYLGQKPPGMTPEIFAPGVISTKNDETGSAFTYDAKLFIFNRIFSGKPYTLYLTELKDGIWTKPSPAPFNSEYNDWDYTIAPDGRTLYFTSMRPVNEGGELSEHGNIWTTQLTPSGWTQPRLLEYPINTDDYHNAYPSISKDGTLYFFSDRKGGFGKIDIFRARLKNGKYYEIENLGNRINTEFREADSFIAPDESYLIFSSNRPGGYGSLDLYVAFRQKDGSWTKPENFGNEINSNKDEFTPSVTPDGRFLFFFSSRTGDGNIFWVSAKVIEELKSDELK